MQHRSKWAPFLFCGLLFFSTFACKSTRPEDPASDLRVVGGKPLPDDHPARFSTVLITVKNYPTCTGVLVAADTLLTAGHCIESDQLADYAVIFGDRFDLGWESLPVLQIKSLRAPKTTRLHPNFDLAWIKFEGALPQGYYAAPVIMEQSLLKSKLPLLRVGYGATDISRNDPGRLLAIDGYLKEFVQNHLYRNILVTGETYGKTTCFGDSGGPAYTEINGIWHVVGTLVGQDTGIAPDQDCSTGVSVYTFAGAYAPWIEESAGIILQGPRGAPVDEASHVTDERTFQDLCGDPLLPDQIWISVRAILRGLDDSKDCVTATKKLKSTFKLNVYEASDLRALAGANQLSELLWTEGDTSDLTPLAKLPTLRTLNLSKNNISNLAPLASLPKLETLYLRENKIFSLNGMERLSNLLYFDVSKNSVTDLSPIKSLKSLGTLYIDSNNVISLDPLGDILRLSQIRAKNNAITNITPLSKLTDLWLLDLSMNAIQDVSPLTSLRLVEYLDLSQNQLRDIKPLSSLKTLRNLALYGNPDLTPGMCPIEPITICQWDLKGNPN